MSQHPPSIGIGMVGHAFMGRAHSQAWRTVDRVFELPLRPRLAAICGPAGSSSPSRSIPTSPAGGPPGHVIGWEHTFTHQARDLLTAIADGAQPEPSFADGLAVQRVLDAAARSAAADGGWETAGEARVSPVRSR